MATQRVIVSKIGGAAAEVVAELFSRWLSSRCDEGVFPTAVQAEIDGFVTSLHEHASAPPILYYAEWIDMWSMGDVLPSLRRGLENVVVGRRFEACCIRPPRNFQPNAIENSPVQEEEWLSHRIEEACRAWEGLVTSAVIVVIREPLNGLVRDEEVTESLKSLPAWLAGLK